MEQPKALVLTKQIQKTTKNVEDNKKDFLCMDSATKFSSGFNSDSNSDSDADSDFIPFQLWSSVYFRVLSEIVSRWHVSFIALA